MISPFKNRHIGQTCIIIGNGPSLRDVPNSFLDMYPTFGTNRIFLKYLPKYYVAINRLLIEQDFKIIDMLSCEKFLPFGCGIESHPLLTTTRKQFSMTPNVWIAEGFTVTYVCLQLAYYMGFDTVLLVGVDHRYKYDGKPNEMNLMPDDDPNHFDPNYFKGMFWHNPDLERSTISYQYAKEAYDNGRRKIINLTPNSDLNVFECDDIKNWIITELQ